VKWPSGEERYLDEPAHVWDKPYIIDTLPNVSYNRVTIKVLEDYDESKVVYIDDSSDDSSDDITDDSSDDSSDDSDDDSSDDSDDDDPIDEPVCTWHDMCL